jgi:hypothetical protein
MIPYLRKFKGKITIELPIIELAIETAVIRALLDI